MYLHYDATRQTAPDLGAKQEQCDMPKNDPLAIQFFAAVILGCALAAAPDCNAHACFVEEILSPPAAAPEDVAIADLNGDGNPDIVYSSTDENTVRWLENSGGPNPTFAPRQLTTSQLPNLRAVVPADLNNDGHTDVAVAYSNQLRWFKNNGMNPPAFTMHNIGSTPISISDIDIALITGDDFPDIYGADFGNNVYWWRNSASNNTPTFGRFTMPSAFVSGPTNLLSVNFDERLGDDLLLAHFAGITMFQEGASFQTGTLAGGVTIFAIAAADLDADGDLDVIASAQDDFVTPGATAPAIIWYERSGQHLGSSPPLTLAQPRVITTEVSFADSVACDDLDADGDADIVVASGENNTIFWLENNGQPEPAFTTRVLTTEAQQAASVDVADMNSDAIPDIAAVSSDDNEVRWFFNAPVENLTAASLHPVIPSALASASPADTLLAYEAHFSTDCAPVLDVTPAGVTLRSRGSIERAPNAPTSLADLTSLESAPGAAIAISGPLNIAPGATPSLVSDLVTLSGPLSLDPGATLHSTNIIELKGESSFVTEQIDVSARSFTAYNLAAGDLTGDHIPDVLLTRSDGKISWLTSTTDPESPFSETILRTDSPATQNPTITDINGDDNADILTYNDASGFTHFFFGTRVKGQADFAETDEFFVPNTPGQPVDLNADGHTDLLNEDVWYRNDGAINPNMTAQQIPRTTNNINAWTAADFDNDGDPDVLMLADDSFWWYENDGLGAFTEQPGTIIGELNPRELFPADADADGDLDLFTVNVPLDKPFVDVPVWLENQGGATATFTVRTIGLPPTDERFRRIVVSDAEGDGDPDVYALDPDGNEVFLLENNGASTPIFTPRSLGNSSSFIRPRTLVVADFDADGDSDVVFSVLQTGFLFRLQNNLVTDQQLTAASIASDTTVSLVNTELTLENGAELSATTSITLDRTTAIAGSGVAMAPNIASAGILRPSEGETLTLLGDYQQTYDDPVLGLEAGSLQVSLAGDPAVPRLFVSGASSLAGALIATAPNGVFNPLVGETFLITDAASQTSFFDAAILPGLPDNKFLRFTSTSRGPAGSVTLIVDTLAGNGIEFDPQDPTPIGGLPTGAALGDVAGFLDGMTFAPPDGLPDLALAIPDDADPTGAPGQLVVLINAGDGGDGIWDGFSGGTITVFTGPGAMMSGGEQPVSVSLGDLDNDKDLDLATANLADGSLSIFINNAPGVLDREPLIPSGVDQPRAVVIADLDGDDRADAAVAGETTPGAGRIAGLISTGAPGNFLPPTTLDIGQTLVWASLGDLDNDKDLDLDLVVADASANAFHALENLGGLGAAWGGFTLQQTVLVNTGIVQASLGDLDNDKDLDVITANRSSGTLSVSLNNSGTLGPAASLPVGTRPRSLALADLDGDSDDDVAVIVDDDSRPGERLVRVLRNDLNAPGGQVIFSPAADVPTELQPAIALSEAPTIGGGITRDLDADGDDDVVTVNENPPSARSGDRGAASSSAAALLQSITTTDCSADLNADGNVGPADLASLLASWGQPGAGDLDNSGAVESADLAVLLAAWGACP